MRGRPPDDPTRSDDVAALPPSRLAAIRVEGFRAIAELDLELDPVTTIIGENAATKAALVDLLDLCLGPGAGPLPRFAVSDFHAADRGACGHLRATYEFVESVEGAWRRGDPDLAGLARRGRGGRMSLAVTVGASRVRSRTEEFVEIAGAGARGRNEAARRTWARLRSACPVLILSTGPSERTGGAAARGPEHAEVARLYRRLRDSRGHLSREDIERARAVLRDHVFPETPRSRLVSAERSLMDLVDWQRRSDQDVTDDAVQDVLLRLLRAGLMLEAQRSGRIDPDASPVVVVDSPEANLHPVMAARVWRFLHSVASQVIVATNSAEVVAASPLRGLRRLVVRRGRVRATRVVPSEFSIDDFRRIIYHVRLKRGNSLLARTWFLLEGETEIWILSEFAAMLGYSFAAEGVACIEFAQCGLAPLLRAADQLAIGWHVLADGDPAGMAYAAQARSRLAGRSASSHVTMLGAPDIEHALWQHGYADVFRRSGGAADLRHLAPKAVIARAIARASKPLLAIRIIERAMQPRSPGVPPQLAAAIKAAVAMSRRAADRD
jgi:putative ATP-dependent endonuclease of OLD family